MFDTFVIMIICKAELSNVTLYQFEDPIKVELSNVTLHQFDVQPTFSYNVIFSLDIKLSQ